MGQPEAAPRPSIVLAVNDLIADHELQELLLGIEEESVPFEVVRQDSLDPLVLAHGASLRSVLGVGVGVGLGYVVVTTDKLPAGRPYLARFFGGNTADDRVIGTNTARLVKRVPLIPLAPALAHVNGRRT